MKEDKFQQFAQAYMAGQTTTAPVEQQTILNTFGGVGEKIGKQQANFCAPSNNYYGGSYGYIPYTYSYPIYVDKTQTAFKLAKKLMDKGLIEVDSVKQFIMLIDLIVGVL